MDTLQFLYDLRQAPYEFNPDLWVESVDEDRMYHLRTSKDPRSGRHSRDRSVNRRVSMFREDPFCFKTEQAVQDFLADTTIYVDTETDLMYNLPPLNLVSTRKFVDAVEVVGQQNNFASWDRWYVEFLTNVSKITMDPNVGFFFSY